MNKLNIVIPMAGRGSRFSQAGYIDPKPLIDIHGIPMIELVIKNLMPLDIKSHFYLICQKDILSNLKFQETINHFQNNLTLIPIDYITNGAAETVLLAKDYINNNDHLMIANCDQYVDIKIDDYLKFALNYDGCIMTMKANHPKWSYIKYENDIIVDVVEKEVVSDDATVGIYNYKSGKIFVDCAQQMINKNFKVNNEFYVAPVYKEIINLGFEVATYDISGKMYGLGTPDDLSIFLQKSLKLTFS